MEKIVKRDGDLALLDFDGDQDRNASDRLYCLAYFDRRGGQHELTIVWKRGKYIRSRSIGNGDASKNGYGKNEHIVSYANLMSYAMDLLGSKISQ